MANALWLLLVLIATLLFYVHRRFYTYDRRFMELASKIPGPRRLPFIGSAYVLGLQQKMLLETFQRILKPYQSVCSVWVGPMLYTIVSNPKDVEVVLSSNLCNEKEELSYHLIASILGDGIITSRGEKWKTHRKMLYPIFSLSNLQAYVDIFYLKSRETYDLLEGELDSPNFNIYSYNEKCGMDIMFGRINFFIGIYLWYIPIYKDTNKSGDLKVILGLISITYSLSTDVSEQAEYVTCRQHLSATNITTDAEIELAWEKSVLLDHIKNVINCLDYRLIKPWLYPDFIYDNLPCGKQMRSNIKVFRALFFKVADYLKRNMILKENRKGILQSARNCDMKGSILNYLLHLQANSENNLTDQDIFDEAATIIGAAFETSTAAIGFILFLLSRHLEVQEEIVHEICHYLGSLDNKPITYNDLCKLHYLDRVVKEGLRLYPSSPYILRRVSEETTLSNGTILPRGSNVFLFIYNLHRDPESFPNPEKFDPDNFLPENVAKRSKYAYAPFSHGPRSCIGQKYAMLSIKTQLVVILRKFCVTSTDIEPELYSVLTLKPKKGIYVGLRKRSCKEQ